MISYSPFSMLKILRLRPWWGAAGQAVGGEGGVQDTAKPELSACYKNQQDKIDKIDKIMIYMSLQIPKICGLITYNE